MMVEHKGKSHFLSKAQEHIGKTYGCLTVEEVYPKRNAVGKNDYYAKCACSCRIEGCTLEYHAKIRNLSTGHLKRCSIAQTKKATAMGMSKERPYHIWKSMVRSCSSENHASYNRRGAKGIKVSSEWTTFAGRWKDNEQHYTDESYFTRKNPFKDFNKENCVWRIAYNASKMNLFDKYKKEGK